MVYDMSQTANWIARLLHRSRLISSCAAIIAVAFPGLLGVAQAASNSQQRRVAVLEISCDSTFDEEDVVYLSDGIRSAVRRGLPVADFIVMTRENISELLPQDRTMSDCLADCAVAVGRKMGADIIATAEILRFGDELRLSLKVHDVATGNLINSVVVSGSKLGDLELQIKTAAMELTAPLRLNGYSGATAPANNAPEPWRHSLPDLSIVEFATSPPGAAVLVDGQSLPLSTPCRAEIAAGPHIVKVMLMDYYAVEAAIEVKLRKTNSFKYELAPKFGTVAITTIPNNVRVALDGKSLGEAPLDGVHVLPGEHVCSLDDSRYYPNSKTLVADEGLNIDLTLEAVPRTGVVQVLARDSNGIVVAARVSVDGRYVGETPVTVTEIIGPHRFDVTHGNEEWTGTFLLKEKSESTEQVDLRNKTPKIAKYPWSGFVGIGATKDADWPADSGLAQRSPWGFESSVGFRVGVVALMGNYAYRGTGDGRAESTSALHDFGAKMVLPLIHGDFGVYGIGGVSITHGSVDLEINVWDYWSNSWVPEIDALDTKGFGFAYDVGVGIDVPIHKWSDSENPGFTAVYFEAVNVRETLTLGAPSDAGWSLEGGNFDFETTHNEYRMGIRAYFE